MESKENVVYSYEEHNQLEFWLEELEAKPKMFTIICDKGLVNRGKLLVLAYETNKELCNTLVNIMSMDEIHGCLVDKGIKECKPLADILSVIRVTQGKDTCLRPEDLVNWCLDTNKGLSEYEEYIPRYIVPYSSCSLTRKYATGFGAGTAFNEHVLRKLIRNKRDFEVYKECANSGYNIFSQELFGDKELYVKDVLCIKEITGDNVSPYVLMASICESMYYVENRNNGDREWLYCIGYIVEEYGEIAPVADVIRDFVDIGMKFFTQGLGSDIEKQIIDAKLYHDEIIIIPFYDWEYFIKKLIESPDKTWYRYICGYSWETAYCFMTKRNVVKLNKRILGDMKKYDGIDEEKYLELEYAHAEIIEDLLQSSNIDIIQNKNMLYKDKPYLRGAYELPLAMALSINVDKALTSGIPLKRREEYQEIRSVLFNI